jgi:dTDP-4-amino-4,6-dideoxygalactose transaminase
VDALVDPSRSLARRLAGRAGRLLRYPVLCADREERDAWLARLRRAGLGPSAMYERPLAQVDGVRVGAGEYPGAARFAARLLTLPVHEGVDARVLDGIRRVLAP